MIISLIGIQTICIGAAAYKVITNFKPKKIKLRLTSNENGFKTYKVKGGN